MIRAFCLALLLLIFSCKEEESIPEYVLSPEDFAIVLTEVHVAESIVRLGYHRGNDSLYLKDSVYASALKKVNSNQIEFDSNLAYYLKDPKELERIYDIVLANLSQRTATLKKKHASQYPEDSIP